MRKLKPREVTGFKQQLHLLQSGVCPLCGEEMVEPMGKLALDHNHITGEVRGLLHMGCNQAEGKVLQAVSTWGKTGRDYRAVADYLHNLADYITREGHGVIYHLHKTDDEKRQLRNRRAREAYARKKAKALVNGV